MERRPITAVRRAESRNQALTFRDFLRGYGWQAEVWGRRISSRLREGGLNQAQMDELWEGWLRVQERGED